MNTDQMIATACIRVEDAATDILTLIEGLGVDEFARSRLTRKTILAKLREIASAAATLPDEGRAAMPEVDWKMWAALDEALCQGVVDTQREWRAASESAGIVLQWMRVYRRSV